MLLAAAAAVALSALPPGGSALAAGAKKKATPAAKAAGAKPAAARAVKAKARAKGAPKALTLHEQLVDLKRKYREGEIGKREMWDKLAWLHDRGDKLPPADRVSLLQTQAKMLSEGGLPILAAIYSSQAIKASSTPLAEDLEPAWEILRRVSERRPIQNLLEIVADTVELDGKQAPVFGTDWNYFAGNSEARRGDTARALKYFGALKLADRYFFPAKYQQAMIYVDQNKLADAEVALKAILYPTSQKLSPLRESVRDDVVDFAWMALGRIYYEQGKFTESAKAYRQVSRDGSQFYDALFEQSWSFFMGGYPMHSLGALHSVESPFYAEVFNPEAPILRALVHYWLCRYEDSRNALADFMEKHAKNVESLDEFLDRQRLDPETAYQLFENLVSGVSSDSLGMPRTILQTAAEKDSMLLVRDQYASIIEEKRRLESKGIFGNKKGIGRPLDYLERWDKALRKDIGRKFLAELQDMKRDFDRLYSQAQFLYVELLMSEKDQLLGKELHASSKITRVSGKVQVGGWADSTQAWKDSKKGEYWWDEIGWYITRVDSQCLVQRPDK
jgi:tetratricopeptide (TPR) repeat protein